MGDVFLFFVLTARFFFLFFSCGSSEEWEKLLEDIKHYPDPNIKVATFDVD